MSQHIHNLMGESMKGLRDLVDVDCIIGKPIVTASGTTIIPISKVTFGLVREEATLQNLRRTISVEAQAQVSPSSRSAF